MNTKLKKTEYHSYLKGELCKGCKYCVKGEKLVLFITGLCPRNCWYCPLSEKRKNKDKIFINEWETKSLKNLDKEIKLCQSKGCGITGGDPLMRIDRTIKYIKHMKKRYGKEFHIHLYTSLDLTTKENLQKLYNAGLDEIRFHLDITDEKLWNKLELAKKYSWKIGVEIPVIPKLFNRYKKIIDYLNNKIDFLNLNELEISDLNAKEMYNRGFIEKNDISYAIKGSLELGKKIIKYSNEKRNKYPIHLCTSKLKDKIQMQNRFKLRAESIKTKYDIITEEGLLLRGIITLKELEETPGILNIKTEKERLILKMKRTYKFLKDEGLDLIFDRKKMRFITYPEHVEQFAEIFKEHKLIPMIIEEDPTVEGFIVNKIYL